MKKRLSLLFSVLFILVFASGAGARAAASGYDVVLRADAPEIDGDLSNAVWAEVPVLNGAFRFPWEANEIYDLNRFPADGTGKGTKISLIKQAEICYNIQIDKSEYVRV